MKLVSFLNLQNEERAGLFIQNQLVDLQLGAREICLELPATMADFLKALPEALHVAQQVEQAFLQGKIKPLTDQTDVRLLAPVPHPTSCRDGYAFRQHVEAARRNRGVPMIAEFDAFPIFYYTNHLAIIGPGELVVEKDHLEQLDFELEVAAVIGKRGKNISVQQADDYICGYTIMNDFSARKLQMEEMKLNLGPAKGKDFATAIGPWLVTKDELAKHRIKTARGDHYDLPMKAYHNGKQVSHGNMKDMHWTFAEILARVSYGTTLYPGDVIGSGTVGTGCYLELNGTWALKAKEEGKSFVPTWLKVGDTIELEVTGLGVLKNRVALAEKSYSLSAQIIPHA